MKISYTLGEIIDFEYFSHEDANTSPDKLHLRDREIAKLLIGMEPDSEPNNATLLSGWILSRREKEFLAKRQDSPGLLFTHSRALATTLVFFKGLLAGLFSGWAFFAYGGTSPINVLQFLLFFVFPQLCIASIFCLGIGLRKLMPGIKFPNTSFHILHSLGSRLFVFINRKWFSNISGSKRDSVRHAYGVIKSKNQRYGSLFYWPVFSLAQLFGITFNIGLLTTSLVKIVTSDLAFGWQSTLQLSSTAIEQLVHLLALPWSWFLPPGISTPTLIEIEGSHIIIKDGIYHLTTGNLIAWWPFLLLCLLFYGLAIRIVFYICGRFMEHRSLTELQLTTPQYAALLRRMRTPIVSTQATSPPPQATSVDNSQAPTTTPLSTTPATLLQTVLIPDDIYESLATNECNQMLEKKDFRGKIKHRFMLGYEDDQQLIKTLAQSSWESNEGIFIIMESWMVPLVDFVIFLKELRNLSTPTTYIEVGLTGEINHGKFTTVNVKDMDIWRNKIGSMGDAYIHLAPITGISQ
ncbi:MAG: hypothetical protein COA36_10405 [Desulfotalea sp.]|nr:MAG: hypothetical protein COA36_10405 [Desulfotalea sp.]